MRVVDARGYWAARASENVAYNAIELARLVSKRLGEALEGGYLRFRLLVAEVGDILVARRLQHDPLAPPTLSGGSMRMPVAPRR